MAIFKYIAVKVTNSFFTFL